MKLWRVGLVIVGVLALPGEVLARCPSTFWRPPFSNVRPCGSCYDEQGNLIFVCWCGLTTAGYTACEGGKAESGVHCTTGTVPGFSYTMVSLHCQGASSHCVRTPGVPATLTVSVPGSVPCP